VLLVRYLVEELDEAALMAIHREGAIANCSISSWRREDGELRPELFNSVEHLHAEGTPPTKQEDVDDEPV
jgi:2,3-bisphosphoglycerate-dependent phosphoglycerate mutase